MDRGAIISEAWSIMRSNRPLWGMALLVFIVNIVIYLVLGLANLLIVTITETPAGSPLAVSLGIILSIVESVIRLLLLAFLSGALISMVNAIADYQPISVSAGLRAGRRWMIPLFFITLLLAVPTWAISSFLTGSVMVTLVGEDGWSITKIQQWIGVFGASVVFILLVSILCDAISIGAERAVVLQNRRLIEALTHGWQLLWTHLSDYVVIGLMLLIVGFAIGLMFGCGIMAAGYVFGPTPGSDYFSSSLTLSAIIMIILNAAANIVITIFVSAAWTLAFREWQAQERGELPVAAK